MGSVERRLRLLETRAASEAKAKALEGTSPFERACAEAVELATTRELEESERLAFAALDRGDSFAAPDPSKDQEFFELWERMLARVGWEAEARVIRDLLLRELEGLESEWEAAGRKHSTWDSDREFWMVANAAANRLHALQRGEPVVTDAGEAGRIVRRVRSPDATLEELMVLVGRQ